MPRTVAVAAMAAGLMALGAAMASGALPGTIPGPDGVYTACYDTGGAVKLFPSGTAACPKGWKGPVTWSQTGPAGPDGRDGTNGLDGRDGTNGLDGTDGTNGLDGRDGTNGLDGKNGAPGADGASAYQVWQDAGHAGTVDDFLASLRGPSGNPGGPGEPGTDGASAYQVWLDQGNTGSEADFLASLRGQPGSPGGGSIGTPHIVYATGAAAPNGMAFVLATCPVGELLLSGGSDGLAGFRLWSAKPEYNHPYAPGAWSFGVYGQNLMNYEASLGASAVCVQVTGCPNGPRHRGGRVSASLLYEGDASDVRARRVRVRPPEGQEALRMRRMSEQPAGEKAVRVS